MEHRDTAHDRLAIDDHAPSPARSTTGPATPAATPDAPPDPGTPAAESPRFTLHRSRTDRMISGVSGGLAESLAVDPTLVRLGFVALALVGFPLGFVLYVAIWMLAPER